MNAKTRKAVSSTSTIAQNGGEERIHIGRYDLIPKRKRDGGVDLLVCRTAGRTTRFGYHKQDLVVFHVWTLCSPIISNSPTFGISFLPYRTSQSLSQAQHYERTIPTGILPKLHHGR